MASKKSTATYHITFTETVDGQPSQQYSAQIDVSDAGEIEDALAYLARRAMMAILNDGQRVNAIMTKSKSIS